MRVPQIRACVIFLFKCVSECHLVRDRIETDHTMYYSTTVRQFIPKTLWNNCHLAWFEIIQQVSAVDRFGACPFDPPNEVSKLIESRKKMNFESTLERSEILGKASFLRETLSVLGRLHRLEVSNRTWKFSAFTPSQAVGTSCGTSTGLVCDKNHSSSEKSARPEKNMSTQWWVGLVRFCSSRI